MMENCLVNIVKEHRKLFADKGFNIPDGQHGDKVNVIFLRFMILQRILLAICH
jgi:hypothetical protein